MIKLFAAKFEPHHKNIIVFSEDNYFLVLNYRNASNLGGDKISKYHILFY